MNIESRLNRIEERMHINDQTYIFIIGKGREFESVEDCDKELKKPKYKSAKVIKIIDLWID
ncbi:hypothetical protein GCM10011409_19990 [Lentibacillus populi]|uniref:Uncharacterized protein n=1 Tax=Lentibacillus populi TaxID=1827502 RepID=A0A9W5TXA6_9BACI|nr:hypothetical protein [Lentibacillus populi]GGB42426.1 hypothetical protein GCM10011409_19990 [Lentibacillus populi]